MTPNRNWEASGPEDVVSTLKLWFDSSDRIEAVEQLESDRFAGCERVGYRFRVRNADGAHLVEQQAYMTQRDGCIGWLRVMCSGFRAVG
jgi:hypothetical protein